MRPLNISPHQAKDYYYQNDPFFSGKNHDNSSWYGKGAKELGLSGTIKKDDFEKIVFGYGPDGKKLIQSVKTSYHVNDVQKTRLEHRAGTDIPFSPDKSVSILALPGKDKRLIQAHDQAVLDTINYIEENVIAARKTIKGVTTTYKTGNAVVSTFRHSTSRANDPQLHTHSIFMNMTKGKDGWRAVCNDEIFKHQCLWTTIYRSELAKQVQKLGYEIEILEGGQFKISGVSQKCAELFSKRTMDINKREKELKKNIDLVSSLNDAELRNIAVLDSRDKKDKKITKEELLERWNNELDGLKRKLRPDLKRIIEGSKQRGEVKRKTMPIHKVIKRTVEIIHEQESTFDRNTLLMNALNLSMGEHTVKSIEKAFNKAVKSGEIVIMSDGKNRHYSTPEMVKIEDKLMDYFEYGNDDLRNIVDPEKISKFINVNYPWFSNGQRRLVESVLSSGQQYIVIQGDAGTGKTTAMKAVNEILKQEWSPYILHGLGFTGKAAAELHSKAGFTSETITRFLSDEKTSFKKFKSKKLKDEKKLNLKKTILVIDESSMVGSRQMAEIMEKAAKNNTIVVFIGDGKQLQAISAGKLFKEIQKSNYVKTVVMDEVMRQKTSHMIEAVRSVKCFIVDRDASDQDGIDQAFSYLESSKCIHECMNDKSKLMNNLVNDYVGHNNRNKTLIITSLNRDRTELNKRIQSKLQDTGKISKNNYEMKIRIPVSMTGVNRYFADSYRPGQYAYVEKSFKCGLKAGQEVKILKTDRKRNKVFVRAKGFDCYSIDLRKEAQLSAYDVEARKFSKGSKIVFLKNDKKLGIENGVTGTIESITYNQLNVKLDESNKIKKIKPNEYSYFDLGFAITAHKSQGQTAENVMLMADTESGKNMMCAENFYVALSRAEYDTKIYTNNVAELKKLYKRNQNKTSTVNLIKMDSTLSKDTIKFIDKACDKFGVEQTKFVNQKIIKSAINGSRFGIQNRILHSISDVSIVQGVYNHFDAKIGLSSEWGKNTISNGKKIQNDLKTTKQIENEKELI